MKHIKDINQFVNEQLFKRYTDAFGGQFLGSPKAGESGASGPAVDVKTERSDETSCPDYNCWSHFGKEAFWNGTSKINGRTVPKITINKTPTMFSISYDGPASGFLLKHAKGGKGDTIHQLMNVLTLELNEYLKTVTAKPDVANIKMEMSGNKLSVTVPLKSTLDHYTIARRGGLGHGGDFTGLLKYKGKKGYEEAKHKSGNLTEKFATFLSD